MKIRTKIQLGTIISLGIIIGISLALFFTYRQVERANIKSATAFEIVNGMFELNMLTHDYLLHHTGRAQIQWQNRHESIGGLLVSKVFKDTEEVPIVNKILSQHGSLRVSFKKLVQNHRKRKQHVGDTVLLDELDDRLIGQLSVKSQSIVSDSHKLEAITHSKFTAVQQSATLFIAVSIIMLILVIGFFVFIIIRNVIRPMAKLQLGAEIIGKGNLKHKIDVRNQDEVGDLANAFNDMAEKLEKSYSSLEAKVKQRTEELDRSNKELEDFAYIVSHDLKAPLRAIHNYADFLQKDLKGNLEDEQEMYLKGLGEAASQSEEYLEDVLELSRVGKHNIKIKNINMCKFLQDLIASLGLPSDVEIILNENLPTMDVETTLSRQIFQNLIINAVKFNNSSQKTIEIGWQQVDNERYEIFVKDNGIGIESRFFEKIFRPFQRLHTSEEYEGTGIGLTIVMKAANRLQWPVRIESTPGEGSTFLITIPKAKNKVPKVNA